MPTRQTGMHMCMHEDGTCSSAWMMASEWVRKRVSSTSTNSVYVYIHI